jgi:8-oxo-dGTP diphosphatase
MMNQSAGFNPHISVDCVIFGFDGDQLRVLLIERPEKKKDASTISGTGEKKHKLPGDLIHLREDLDRAAERVLAELTGLEQIFLRQLAVFGDPGRIPDNEDRQWLEQSSGIKINRVVTTAYYSLIRIDKSNTVNENSHHASWYPVDALPSLIFDHREIILTGLEKLRNEIRFEPLCFELLPGKFTIRQIQTLYEVIFGQPLDNRNFRKKLLKAPYIEPLGEKEKGVAHKPALFYRFNKKKYLATRENLLYYNF